ncbi:hypothetical protein GP486_002191 [Trichoglossum hirsutum]|uniref:Uncharacterized protein n=1 Tax=Trichoglossum hirsutum TaxID=265104 RepID=A0A9P8LFG7_9PEZI|nr:hypothetical protein GP486_002191 [Trichoglossum hirsutum]
MPGPGVDLGDERGLDLLGRAQEAGLRNICQCHLRLLAAGAFGLQNNMSRDTICRRLEAVYRHRDNLQEFKRSNAGWFRRDRRPAVPEDSLGVFLYVPLSNTRFGFNEVQVFERFAGEESWQVWQKDGTINVERLFWYLNLSDFRRMIDIEFAVYRHHHRTPQGAPRLGWRRNMFYSLIQQLVRQDPGYYGLHAAARPDKAWRLISYPYITKDTDTDGDTTGFLHIDLGLDNYLKDERGGSRLTSSLSLDDERKDGCTLVVKGFQRHLGQWIKKLQRRRGRGFGFTTNCNNDVYRAEDRALWGEPEPVPCQAWGVRITLPQLIHGSTTKSVRQRRTILPWFTAICDNHEDLEIGCVRWSELRRCHLDLEVPARDAGGQGWRFGAPKERFLGSEVLGSSSALGDALVGRRMWTDPSVLRERDLLLGSNCQTAMEYVNAVRNRLVEQYRKAFEIMVRNEIQSFGPASYFKTVKAQEAGFPWLQQLIESLHSSTVLPAAGQVTKRKRMPERMSQRNVRCRKR